MSIWGILHPKTLKLSFSLKLWLLPSSYYSQRTNLSLGSDGSKDIGSVRERLNFMGKVAWGLLMSGFFISVLSGDTEVQLFPHWLKNEEGSTHLAL